MTRRKRLLFALVAIVLAVATPLAVTLCADIYLHHRVERRAGVNIWGYRGPKVPARRSGEHRMAVLGGSTVFGYGVEWNETIPFLLQNDLRPLSRGGAPVSVINLGIVGHGAYSFRWTLEDYLGLDFDTVVLYEGYNDMGEVLNLNASHRDSPVFRLTGYYPVLPVALHEKAMALRYGGDVDAFYRGDKTVFRPNLAARTTAGALDAAAAVGRTLDAQLGRLASAPVVQATGGLHVSDTECITRWKHYCGAVYDAVTFALAHRKKVLVVTQPYVPGDHREQQAELRMMLRATFAGNPNLAYVNLGDAIDVMDGRLSFDHMHLTVEGNRIVARYLVAPVAALMPDAFNSPTEAGRRGTE